MHARLFVTLAAVLMSAPALAAGSFVHGVMLNREKQTLMRIRRCG